MSEKEILEARLSEAETALHSLMIGQSVTVVDYDGRSTRYAPSDEGRLRAYIRELQQSLGKGPRRRAIAVR